MVLRMQVLLVEPCDMVRQVNELALCAWGTSVCAVKTEDEAISRLRLRSEPPCPPRMCNPCGVQQEYFVACSQPVTRMQGIAGASLG